MSLYEECKMKEIIKINKILSNFPPSLLKRIRKKIKKKRKKIVMVFDK